MTDLRAATASRKIREILARAEEGDFSGLEDLGTLIEVRRLPQGRFILAPKGAPRDLGALSQAFVVDFRSILDAKRKAKRSRYFALKGDAGYKGPRIVAEGDSWFEFPCATDLLEWLGRKYAILSLARAGDAWFDVNQDELGTYDDGSPKGLLATIAVEKPDIVMLSVGGNDIMGSIENYVFHYEEGRPRDRYIRPNFDELLDYVALQYRTRTSQIVATGAQVLLHGYDYPDPRPGAEGGQWIGGPLENACRIGDRTLWRQIVNAMIERFCDRLQAIADASNGKVQFVRQLGTIGSADHMHGPNQTLWNDELHGSSEGFRRLSLKLGKRIDEIFAPAIS